MIKKIIYFFIATQLYTTIQSSDNPKKDFDTVISDLKYDIFAGHLVQHFPEEDINNLIDYINQPVDQIELRRRSLDMKQSVIHFHKNQSFPKVSPGNNIYTYLAALKNVFIIVTTTATSLSYNDTILVHTLYQQAHHSLKIFFVQL